MKVLLLALTLLPLWPMLQALAYRGFCASFRKEAFALAGLLLAGATLAVLLAWRMPPALPVTAAAGVLTALALAWWSRPAFGRKRGLPPGSLAPLQPASSLDDSFFARGAARHGRLFKYRQSYRPAIAVVDIPLGLELLRTQGERLRYPEPSIHRLIPGGFLRSMPPEAHRFMRRRLIELFTADVVEAQQDFLNARVRAAAAALAAAGAAHPHGVIHDLMFDVALKWFTGLDGGSPAAASWKSLYIALNGPGDEAAFARLDALWRAREAELAPPNRAPCFLSNGMDRRAAGTDDRALRGQLLALLLVAWRDTAGLLEWITYHLSGAGAWLDRVRATPDPDELADRLVSECLRLGQSEYILRRVLEPFRFHGYLFPAGWRIRICIREGHRDPLVFPDPQRVDADRFCAGGPPPEQYSPLGAFQHACLGEQLVRTAGKAWVRALAEYHVERVADGPRVRGPFNHWVPSPRLLIRLRPRPAAPAGHTGSG